MERSSAKVDDLFCTLKYEASTLHKTQVAVIDYTE